MPGAAVMPATEATLTIALDRPAATASRLQARVPSRFTSKSLRTRSSPTSKRLAVGGVDARVVDEVVEPAELGRDRGEDLRAVARVVGLADDADRDGGSAEFRDRGGKCLLPARGDQHPGPVVDKAARDREPDAAARPGDERRLSVETSRAVETSHGRASSSIGSRWSPVVKTAIPTGWYAQS